MRARLRLCQGIPYAKIKQQGTETDVHQLLKCTHFTLLIGVSDSEDARGLEVAAYFRAYKRLPLAVHILAKASDGSGFHQAYGIKKEAMFLLRPDGHIGFRTAKLEPAEVEKYLDFILAHYPENK